MGNVDADKFIQTNEQYGDGIAVNIYKNEYSLVAARKNGDDIWMEWVYPARQDGPGEKKFPLKLSLGMKAEAVQKLEKLIFLIEGRPGANPVDQEPIDDDCPF